MISQEIERKFLIKGDFKKHIKSSFKIAQGYLSSAPERNVRIRIKDDKGYITIKGIGNKSGISRFEWEKEIPIKEATELFKLCESGAIDKIRHIIPTNGGLFFEVDEFLDKNQGLLIAEIELPSEGTLFEKPDWLGEEVTGDVKYYNSYLTKHPFTSW